LVYRSPTERVYKLVSQLVNMQTDKTMIYGIK